MHRNDPSSVASIQFSNEANFHLNGEVNRQNLRYWCDTNPHWMSDSRMQCAAKIMVWCGLWDNMIADPFFIEGNVNADVYSYMLQNHLLLSVLNQNVDFHDFFQQYGAPPQYGITVPFPLDRLKWSVEWPSRSPDITPVDIYLWEHLKTIVYQKNNNFNHLMR
ncbi:hypothetical protein PR048_001588 [Dryococelus australis]|uniref:Uncharacterized protein n=1 Tax=Dryococelus australis TaxID=614101 RepID=A0ABQ9IJ90_9NEOP|nr:hypothetical protein PR048_001588 [Dryococelus australis]